MAERRTVVVAGSLHYDIMLEAGGWPRQGETIAAKSWRPKLGGKGRNQAVAAREAGAPVQMVGRIGDDAFGRALASDLERRGIDTRFLVRGAAGSGMSVAIADASRDYRAFIVSGANLDLGAADLPPAAELRAAGVMVLQNEVPEAANVAAARAAGEAGVRVVLNAAPYRPMSRALLDAVDILVVNAVEAAQLGGISEPATLEEALAAARHLRGQARVVLVTAGAAGAAYVDADQSITVPAERVTLVSSHGAGDAFVGTLAASLAAGNGIETAMRAASAAAARLVSGHM